MMGLIGNWDLKDNNNGIFEDEKNSGQRMMVHRQKLNADHWARIPFAASKLLVKLLIQPDDGVQRLVKGIKKAKERIEIMIFRFDRTEIERALIDAVERGVFVHALIAFTNRGGEQSLRKLEKHFLANGITVARTAGDLVRYHGKMMIVDRKELYVNAFNFTYLDIDRSRAFGLITRNPKLVAEAVKLFQSDIKRQGYAAGNSKFLVSPVNARKELTKFIQGKKRNCLSTIRRSAIAPCCAFLKTKRKPEWTFA